MAFSGTPTPTSATDLGTGGNADTPAWPSLAAVAAAIISALLLVVSHANRNTAAIGYAVGALVTPALVVCHRFMVRAAQRSVYYVPRITLARLALVAVILGGCAGIANAWFLATQLAKK